MNHEPLNLNKPEIKVAHSELERLGEDSAYKSKCPACADGVLLVYRDETFNLQRHDRCISCGQQFFYTDSEINGERFKVPYPMFELVGPPCETPGCKGVLVNTINTKTQMSFKKCATCDREHYKMPLGDAMDWSVRTILSALKGEKSN